MSGRAARLGLCACLLAGACTVDNLLLVRDPDAPPPQDSGAKDAGRPPTEAGALDGSMPTAGSTPPPPMDAAPFMPVARCGRDPCACDDGEDNDGDGLVDGFDPECTGALDQDESSFATGQPNTAKPCLDCYWDQDQGNGNDGCWYPAQCLDGVTLSGNGMCGSCEVTERCVDNCAARTPNGCDCFGCCEVWRPNGVKVTVELRDSCALDKLDDLTACPRCTQSSQCRNTCGRCELCPGRTLRDLPADCGDAGPTNRCDEGQPVCSTSADCTTDQYCQLGCCFLLLL